MKPVYNNWLFTEISSKYLPGGKPVEALNEVVDADNGHSYNEEPRVHDGIHNNGWHTEEDKLEEPLHRNAEFLEIEKKKCW